MKHATRFSLVLAGVLAFHAVLARNNQSDSIPIIGLCIGAPSPEKIDSFVQFIDAELAPRGINTIVMRVDYKYQYKSHPELRDSVALSESDIKKMVNACKAHHIRIIPQINLLGHQSWANHLNRLLSVYPEFDETPQVAMPEKYEWPNPDNLYCKSYCPLHPDVHEVIFALIDEITSVFETNAFHAGMDEVFYLADPKCPRCGGRDPAELFAGEVTKIRNHLAASGKELWIWGDRLLDGKTTGLGMWEASYNNTYRAIDLIPTDVVICDWHYERPDKTPVYFAMKGFRVISCPWRKPEVATGELQDLLRFRNESTKEMAPRFYGIMQTEWSGADRFMRDFYTNRQDEKRGTNTPWHTFRALFDAINQTGQTPATPKKKK